MNRDIKIQSILGNIKLQMLIQSVETTKPNFLYTCVDTLGAKEK